MKSQNEFDRKAAKLRLKWSSRRLEEINAIPQKAKRDRELKKFWEEIEAAYTLLREPPGRFQLHNPFEESPCQEDDTAP